MWSGSIRPGGLCIKPVTEPNRTEPTEITEHIRPNLRKLSNIRTGPMAIMIFRYRELTALPVKMTKILKIKCDGIASLGNMQISNSRLCESSKCWVYSAVNHPWWMSMLFHRRGFCGLARPLVTFGGSGGMMPTARTELPYP